MVVFIMFIGSGAWGLVVSLVQLRKAIASRGWTPVDGEIIHSEFQSVRRIVYPDIRYRYTANSIEWEGDQVAFGGPFGASWPGPAVRALQRYWNGRRVKVWISPHDPTESVLEPGVHWYALIPPLISSLVLAFGILQMLRELISSKRE